MRLVVDSWANAMFGILSGNLPEFGSFSDCFHIERNGQRLQTQYCLGLLIENNIESYDISSIMNFMFIYLDFELNKIKQYR